MLAVSVVQDTKDGTIVAIFDGATKEASATVARKSLFLTCNRIGEPIAIASMRPEVGRWTDVWKMPTGELLQVVTDLSKCQVDHL